MTAEKVSLKTVVIDRVSPFCLLSSTGIDPSVSRPIFRTGMMPRTTDRFDCLEALPNPFTPPRPVQKTLCDTRNSERTCMRDLPCLGVEIDNYWESSKTNRTLGDNVGRDADPQNA